MALDAILQITEAEAAADAKKKQAAADAIIRHILLLDLDLGAGCIV